MHSTAVYVYFCIVNEISISIAQVVKLSFNSQFFFYYFVANSAYFTGSTNIPLAEPPRSNKTRMIFNFVIAYSCTDGYNRKSRKMEKGCLYVRKWFEVYELYHLKWKSSNGRTLRTASIYSRVNSFYSFPN